MCGIAGIINWKSSPGTLERAILAMQLALSHRGPDDQGIWLSDEGSTAFGHRRLSILDPSSAGRQPMSLRDLRIVFNGEIYNFSQLRDQLSEEVFTTSTDTEVLLHEYERYGAACVQRLEGMFAFAIYKESDRSLFLARDPFGIKPLYYSEHNGVFVFASEVRALLASGLVPGSICPEGLNGFLRTGSVQEPHTLVQGVHMLPAGCTLTRTSEGIVSIRKEWEINFQDDIHDPETAIAGTAAALEETITRHFVSDVPVGIFLSGGIDSTAIAGIAARQGRDNTHTYSLGGDDPKFDETSEAAQIARLFGTSHHEMRLDRAIAQELFTQYLDALDQPSVDGFNTFCVSHFASSLGAKVVLSGVGGDELFGGYPSFQRVPSLLQTSHTVRAGQFPAKQVGQFIEKYAPDSRARRAGEWLGTSPSLGASYHFSRSIFSQQEAIQISRKFGLPDCDALTFPDYPGESQGDAVSRLELSKYMRNQLLRDSDVMSMAHGLELRMPFVDRTFFSEISRIVPAIRLQPGKRLLVHAAGCIPDFVANAPKRGFSFPIQKWFGSDLQTRLEQKFSLPLVPWYRAWTLHTLECWLKNHNML